MVDRELQSLQGAIRAAEEALLASRWTCGVKCSSIEVLYELALPIDVDDVSL
jgi:hypothetical protein